MHVHPPFFSFTVLAEESGQTFSQILHRRGFSRSLARRLRLHGEVRAAGVPVRMIDTAQAGLLVTLSLPVDEHSFMAHDLPLDIVFEDAHILVLNKPAGILVHPTGHEQTGTLANGVIHYLKAHGEAGLAGPVTRLDRDTSGLVLFAKHPHAHYRLARDLEGGYVDRVYMAIVAGSMMPDVGVMDAPIRRVAEFASEREVGEGGQSARTRYRVVTRYGTAGGHDAASCVRLELETGRTHQIRVHLSHHGHPILGDALYGRVLPDLMERQALHAIELRLVHPITRQPLSFSCDLPNDMLRLQQWLCQTSAGER